MECECKTYFYEFNVCNFSSIATFFFTYTIFVFSECSFHGNFFFNTKLFVANKNSGSNNRRSSSSSRRKRRRRIMSISR